MVAVLPCEMPLTALRIRVATGCVALTLVACNTGATTSGSTGAVTTAPTSSTTLAPVTSPPAATTPTSASTPATPPPAEPSPATDWANFEYRSAECGSFTPITLTDGEYTNQQSAVVVFLGQSVPLESGETLVVLHCLAGPSGDTRSTELLLFGPDASELAYQKLPAGEPTITTDGVGSLEYDVYGPDDPRCCPSGSETLMFTATDGTILVAMP